MSQEKDKLRPIAPELWPELRDLFKRNWPRNEVSYNTIQNYINWTKIEPQIKRLKILSLNGSWRKNGTYIIIDRYYMFFHTLEKSKHSLRLALGLVNWNNSYRINQLHQLCRSTLDEIMQEFGIKMELDNQTVMYKMAKEESLKLEITLPEGFRLKKLKPEHVAAAIQVWPNRCEALESTLKRLAEWNPSIGLFNSSDKLVAWCLCWTTGSISVVAHEHYESLAVKAMAKEMAKLGMDCYASVNVRKTPFKRLFRELGFLQIGFYHVAQTGSKKSV